MRNDDVIPFKISKNSKQVSCGQYWCVLVDLAYLKESVEDAFLVVSFTQKKRHFQPSVK